MGLKESKLAQRSLEREVVNSRVLWDVEKWE